LNHGAHDAIAKLLATVPDAAAGAPLFQSRKGGKALTVSTLNNMVKNGAPSVISRATTVTTPYGRPSGITTASPSAPICRRL